MYQEVIEEQNAVACIKLEGDLAKEVRNVLMAQGQTTHRNPCTYAKTSLNAF
jgi:hypothetical protein